MNGYITFNYKGKELRRIPFDMSRPRDVRNIYRKARDIAYASDIEDLDVTTIQMQFVVGEPTQ